MNKQHFLIGLAAVGISLLFNQPVFAECGAGKTDVTIINPAGKIIEICVPDAAIPAIADANPGGTVIPGRCPCFSPEDVESPNQTEPLSCASSDGITDSGLNCTGTRCDGYSASTTQRPLHQPYFDEPCNVGDTNDPNYPGFRYSISCKAPNENGLSYEVDGLTLQEAEACLAILETLLP